MGEGRGGGVGLGSGGGGGGRGWPLINALPRRIHYLNPAGTACVHASGSCLLQPLCLSASHCPLLGRLTGRLTALRRLRLEARVIHHHKTLYSCAPAEASLATSCRDILLNSDDSKFGWQWGAGCGIASNTSTFNHYPPVHILQTAIPPTFSFAFHRPLRRTSTGIFSTTSFTTVFAI